MQLRQLRPMLWAGLLCLAAPAWCQEKGAAGEPGGSAKAKVGAAAPDFTLNDESGKKHSLADWKDKVVVLEWVNQQCPWSVKAIDDVKKLRQKYDSKGVVWIGVESTHSRKPEENVQYIKDKQLNFPILMDPDGKVGRSYGAMTTPHIFVIAKGKLVYAGALHNNQQGDKDAAAVRNYVAEALDAVLASQEVPVAETKPWGCSVKYKDQPK
jgi:peroxiredoxin